MKLTNNTKPTFSDKRCSNRMLINKVPSYLNSSLPKCIQGDTGFQVKLVVLHSLQIFFQLGLFFTVRDDFDPLDPSIIRDPTLVNEPIDCKVKQTRKAFLHRICIALRQFRTPIYNAIANFFIQSGFIDLEELASYNLASPYKYRAGPILDHVQTLWINI